MCTEIVNDPPPIQDSGYHCFKNLACGNVTKDMVEYGHTSCADSDSHSTSESEQSEYFKLNGHEQPSSQTI